MTSGAWLKPPPQGRLSQGPKPLALSQLPEATPPSAESQGRTFREGLEAALPDPVPWKQPDLAVSVSPLPFLPLCNLCRLPWGSTGPGRRGQPAARAANSCKPLYPSASGTPWPTGRGTNTNHQQDKEAQLQVLWPWDHLLMGTQSPSANTLRAAGPVVPQSEPEGAKATEEGFPTRRKTTCIFVERATARKIWV